MIQSVFNLVLCFLFPTFWLSEEFRSIVREKFLSVLFFECVVGVTIVVNFFQVVGFVALCFFHIYLISLGKGTYDWVVSNQSKVSNHKSHKSPRHFEMESLNQFDEEE